MTGINIDKIKEIKIKEVPDDLFHELKESQITEDDPPKYYEPILKIIGQGYQNYKPILTRSNISCIKGKAKSRKTFAVTLLMSACVYGSVSNILLCENHGNVIYFDTEQGDYHVYKVIRRVSGIQNKNEQSEFFAGFALRKFEPDKRIKLIETAIYRVPKISLIVIDGIRDLVYDINDQKEATMVTTKLMKWSKEVNCHICTIIHENKSDGSARGHIGTEIQNKSETVLTVEKEGNYSIVKPEYTRDEDFASLQFNIVKTDKCFIPNLEFYEPEF